MVIRKYLLINKEEALTVEKVKAFADALEIRDSLPTMIKVRVWTSGSNFFFKEMPARVTVWKKFPHLVLTDHGIMTWNELVLGYCHMAGLTQEAAENAAASSEIQREAA